MTEFEAAVDAAMRRALDGAGAVLRTSSLTEVHRVAELATTGGATVVSVTSASRGRGMAFGSLWCALDDLRPVEGIAPIGAGAITVRSGAWMRSALVAELLRRTEDGIVVIAIEPGSLDEAAATHLEQLLTDAEELSVVWAIGEVTGRARPDLPRSGDDRHRSILEMLAMAGIALDSSELATLEGVGPEAIDQALAELVDAGVVVACRGFVAIEDEALRRRVLTDLPSAVVHGVRRAVLEPLRLRGVPSPLLAELVVDSPEPGDGLACAVLTEAMGELAGTDVVGAAEFGFAATRTVTDSEQLATLAGELLPLLWKAGRVEEARALARRVFTEQGQADAEARILMWLARFEPSEDEAVRLTSAALVLRGVSESTRLQLLGIHLRVLSLLGRHLEVARLLPTAIAEAREAGEWLALSTMLTMDAVRNFYKGAYGRSMEIAAEVELTRARSGADIVDFLPEMAFRPLALVNFGDPEGGYRLAGELIEAVNSRTRGVPVDFLHAERALALLIQGRLAEAADENALGAHVAGVGADSRRYNRLDAIAVSVQLKIALHRGDVAELDELQRMLEAQEPMVGSEAWARVQWWLFLIHDARGFRPGIEAASALEHIPWLDPADEVLVTRALLINGLLDSAATLATAARDRVDRSGRHPLAVALAEHLTGLVETDADALARAKRGWRSLGRVLVAASATSDEGAVRMLHSEQAGGRERGRRLLVEAHQELVELGADRDAWRIRRALRMAGHPLAPTREPRTASPLTPSERRVVERAVLGRSVVVIARELDLSPHTVTTHLRHVYAKLGVSTRAELAERMSALGF